VPTALKIITKIFSDRTTKDGGEFFDLQNRKLYKNDYQVRHFKSVRRKLIFLPK
jgi:hypothetical protein